ncbi:MAG: UDP-N-acetylmuramoyl-L-alanine--D-glutamate ligase [Butyricicoccus pullicaecorum]|nr:UDP-N-acetylmuramoyl-L-alanine--D-glutamate ligase [Butyricicoccus pullicaecorum]
MTALEEYLKEISGQRIGVIGAGVSNIPLVSMLREAGLSVTVHDRKTEAELGEVYQTLQAHGASFSLGVHYLDTLEEPIVFRTPGLHPNHPALEQVRARGGVVTSEMELFFRVCPCRIIGITGSDGKTTTTTLTYEFLKHAGYTCHLGGNIGAPLLPAVPTMKPDDLAIVELSSFQLMGMQYSPDIAAITNLTPNHLDYHKDFSEYIAAKTSIFTHQKAGSRLVLNADDRETRMLDIPGDHRILTCSKLVKPDNGVYLREGTIYIAEDGKDRTLMQASDIRIPGAHNVSNVMMAAAIVQGLCEDSDITEVAKTFAGVEHRIELVRKVNGVSYYNDSIASSPTRTIAGLDSFDQKLILIAGGYDKHLSYEVLGKPICDHVKTLLLTGATAPKLRACTEQADAAQKPEIFDLPDLAAAVAKAHELASVGDIVLLSPASASFDCFKNFAERGNCFKALVNQLPES